MAAVFTLDWVPFFLSPLLVSGACGCDAASETAGSLIPAAGITTAVAEGQRVYFFFVRVAPPRPRSVTPDSESTRCTKP